MIALGMRIAVLSDIHANRLAFEAVQRAVADAQPDHVVVAGDVINRGPEPRVCLEGILRCQDEQGWKVLKGNHEDFVLQEAAGHPFSDEWVRKLYAHTHWTMQRVRDLLPSVEKWPDHHSIRGPDGTEVRFVHASMRSNRHGLYEEMKEPELAELTAPSPAVLVAGHTHVPFIRQINGTLIVNAGAVGMSFDGIQQASFALLDWKDKRWHAQIIRVDYDHDATEQAFFDTGFIDDAGVMAPLILDEWRQARPRLGPWHRHYESRVASGQLTIEESVALLLEEVGAAPAVRNP